MSIYTATRTLPSCKVERELLVELEEYIRQKMETLYANNPKAIPSVISYKVIINDSVGSETLFSIKDYNAQYFPNDIRAIHLKSETSRHNMSLVVKFGLIKDLTQVEMSYEGDSAREIVTGVCEEIIKRIKVYETNNYIFQSSSAFTVIPALFFPVSLALIAQILDFPGRIPKIVQPIATALLLISIGWFIVMSFKPYSTFKTRRNEIRERRLSWVLLGFLGFVLFTVIGVYFRNQLLGF